MNIDDKELKMETRTIALKMAIDSCNKDELFTFVLRRADEIFLYITQD